MSVATQIERIKTNIANAYASAEAKGATIPDVKNSENLPATINSISSGSSSSFLGISLNDALGIINGGSLVKPTTPFNINFDGVNSLGSRIFYYKFYNTKVASVNGGSLQTIGQYAFQYAFSYCGSLTEFLMPNVTTIDAYGMNQVCSNSAGLTTIDFSSLETVLDAVSVACAQIYTKAENDKSLSGMGTTLSGVSICDDTCNVYNVGDSRVYILRAGVLTQITEDHSVVRQLFRQGAISEEEMASHPQKNLITRAVGVRKEVEVDVSEIRLKKGDRLLCASDGLTNFVPRREIEGMMMQQDLYAVPDMLIKAALKKDASDNITALVLEY